MDILMIVHTMGTLDPSDNDRFTYLAKMLVGKGHNVEIVTSDFEHHKKAYRNTEAIVRRHSFKITFLHEDAYQKNISVQRIAGHISFAKRLKKYLKKRNKPDAIYCAIPPTVSADCAASYAEKNQIRFIIDVQDLWPESFNLALGNSALAKLALKPLASIANGAYKRADGIVAVSETYVRRVKKVNTKAMQAVSVYLGTDSKLVEDVKKNMPMHNRQTQELRVAYIGNLGRSYDFLTLFKALHLLEKIEDYKIRLLVIGDGNYRNQVEALADKYFANTLITGYLSYDMMFAQLMQCDIAVNPIVRGTANSVVNKVGDYAAAGLPVVNSQDNNEYCGLIEQYNAGLNSLPGDAEDMAKKIEMLCLDANMRKQLGQNNRKLYEAKFDRSKTYPAIVDCLLGKDRT